MSGGDELYKSDGDRDTCQSAKTAFESNAQFSADFEAPKTKHCRSAADPSAVVCDSLAIDLMPAISVAGDIAVFEPPPTLEDTRAAVLAAADVCGRAPVLKVLRGFGAERATTLAPEHRRAVTNALAEMRAGHRRTAEKAAAGYLNLRGQEVVDVSRPATDDAQALAPAVRYNGIKPGDTIEEMLTIQLMGMHEATVDCTRRAHRAEFAEQRKDNLAMAVKASRTFATLVEVLDRHRRGGEQKVIVEHVHVHAGGQAIVGAITGGGGGQLPKLAALPDGA